MKTRYSILLGGSLLSLLACGQEISSSELSETKAEDLKLYLNVNEKMEKDETRLRAQLYTVPDNVPIEFDQGEKLFVQMALPNENFEDRIELEREENDIFVDSIENNLRYFYTKTFDDFYTNVTYKIIYRDKDRVETTATIQSLGIPSLLLPDEIEHPENTLLRIEWEPIGLDYVDIFHPSGEEIRTEDDGEETINVSSSGDIFLLHCNSIEDVPIFKKSHLTVCTSSNKTKIILQ